MSSKKTWKNRHDAAYAAPMPMPDASCIAGRPPKPETRPRLMPESPENREFDMPDQPAPVRESAQIEKERIKHRTGTPLQNSHGIPHGVPRGCQLPDLLSCLCLLLSLPHMSAPPPAFALRTSTKHPTAPDKLGILKSVKSVSRILFR